MFNWERNENKKNKVFKFNCLFKIQQSRNLEKKEMSANEIKMNKT